MKARDREDALRRLHEALADMDLPDARRTAVDDFDLRWLGRNMAVRNRGHARFGEAAATLRELGVRFVLDR